MTIVEAIRAFGDVDTFIVNDLPQLATTIAAKDTVGQITTRVQELGVNKDGISFSEYSEAVLPATFFIGRSKNLSADKELERLSKEGIRVSYKGFRELNNLPTQFKNFTFSGEMFKKFGVKRVEPNTNGFTIFLGGTTDDSQNKIDWTSEQEQIDIIENNKVEAEHFEEALNFVIEQKIGELLR